MAVKIDTRQILNRAALAAIGSAANATTDTIFADINTILGNATNLPTASVLVQRDANGNTEANSFIDQLTTTATAAGTTTLTVGSTYYQQFTGTTTQTVVLPSTATLVVGQAFMIMNRSTGALTVNTSTGALVQTMASQSQMLVTCTSIANNTAAAWDDGYSVSNALSNPMTTLGDIIYGLAGGTPQRLAGSTSASMSFLSQTGTGSVSAAPVWTGFTAPTVSMATSSGTGTGGFGNTQVGYVFNITTSTTCAVGDTYTNNSNTFTVQAALTAQTGQVLFMSGTGALSGTTLTRATGSGSVTITFTNTAGNPLNPSPTYLYTVPASPRKPLYIEVEMIGGGGGGGAASTTSTASVNGVATFFGTLFTSAGGGGAGPSSSSSGIGGSGGILNYNSGPWLGSASITTYRMATGGTGGPSQTNASNDGLIGGSGGFSPFGLNPGGYGNAQAPIANTGGGGGGAGGVTTTSNYGAGGGGGAYMHFYISQNNLSSTYLYAVGTGGNGGTGTWNGGAGSSGIIIIKEFYQ